MLLTKKLKLQRGGQGHETMLKITRIGQIIN